MGSKTKKTCKWIVVALLCPVLLFLLLTILIYLPPVQNWLVGQVTSYASEKTGMQISVDHVNLDFPLDLGIDGFRMIQGQDTIADVEHMTVDVELLPLLRKRVVIDELGITTLTIVNEYDGEKYYKRLYCAVDPDPLDGDPRSCLWESFNSEETEFRIDSGETICELNAFEPTIEDGMLKVDLESPNGTKSTIRIALRTGGAGK